MDIINLMLWPGFLFLVILGSGIWTGRGGKPYNSLLFNIHKLIALGTVILTGIRLFELDPFNTFPNLASLLLVMAVLGVVVMFATGAVMSIKDEVPRPALLVHRIIPAAILLSILGMIYLILKNQLKTL